MLGELSRPDSQAAPQDEEGDLLLGFWCVGIVDLLGQRDRLRHLTSVPTDKAEYERALGVLKETLGPVLQLRESFRRTFEIMAQPTHILHDLSPDALVLAKQMRRTDVETHGFSDSFLLATSLRTDDPMRIPMTSIYAMLYSTAGMMIAGLADGHPLRGGVDVGVGVRIAHGDVYGPVVVRAHELESEHAQYPRVVLGETLVRYVSGLQAMEPTTPQEGLARDLARESAGIITRDGDGLFMIDALGPGMRRFENTYTPAMLKAAQAFVTDSHDRFTAAANIKLASRYGRLRRYLEARLPDWGVK